jgi:hypothetical protein
MVPVQWHLLEHFARQLPKLTDLRCNSKRYVKVDWPEMPLALLTSLTGITRLDLGQARQRLVMGSAAVLGGARLPALRAACFHDIEDLSTVALLAPNLQQLSCKSLSLDVAKPSHTAALPLCTHFGAEVVLTTATAAGGGVDAAAAAAAAGFAAAFPALQTISEMPEITFSAPGIGLVMISGEALTQLRQPVKALRMRGCKPFMLLLPQQLQPLHQLQRLWLFQVEPRLIRHLEGLAAKVPQLCHILLTFLGKTCTTQLQVFVRELAKMPDLKSLALPAYMLCSRCSPKGFVQTSLQSLQMTGCLQHCRLIALGCCYHCKHAGNLMSTRGYVKKAYEQQTTAAASSTTEQQQQQQQVPHLLCLSAEPERVGSSTWLSSEEGFWGAYGPTTLPVPDRVMQLEVNY